jgi:Zn-dependent protease with chaperone function
MLSKAVSKFLKATPFPSESLDNLADAMLITKFSKIDKLDRYYRVRFLSTGGMAFLDRVFFDSNYLEILLPDELQAVAAHEFTHLKNRHGTKKFFRLTVPMVAVGAFVGLFFFFNFTSIGTFPLISNLGKVATSLLAALLFGFLGLFAALHVNAEWLRSRETECDLSTIKYLNGTPMILALIKLNNIRQRRITRIDKLIPKIYPTIEQRISDLRIASENKQKQNSSIKYIA